MTGTFSTASRRLKRRRSDRKGQVFWLEVTGGAREETYPVEVSCWKRVLNGVGMRKIGARLPVATSACALVSTAWPAFTGASRTARGRGLGGSGWEVSGTRMPRKRRNSEVEAARMKTRLLLRRVFLIKAMEQHYTPIGLEAQPVTTTIPSPFAAPTARGPSWGQKTLLPTHPSRGIRPLPERPRGSPRIFLSLQDVA